MSDRKHANGSLVLEQLVDDPVGTAPRGPVTLVLRGEAFAEALGVLRDRIERLENRRGDRDRKPVEPGGAPAASP